MEKERRCGFVALVGCTNAGKSTFINAIVHEKVAIVSPKVHSTRFSVMGIVVHEQTQILFIDTPGLGGGKKSSATGQTTFGQDIAQADIVLFIVDAHRGINEDVKKIARKLAHFDKAVWLVFNKVDMIDPTTLLPLTQKMLTFFSPQEVFMVSAKKGEGLDELRDQICRSLPVAPHLYPEDVVTDQPDRVFVAEIIREELLLRLRNEIPYNLTVDVYSFDVREGGDIVIRACICVPQARYKPVILGKGGQKIREIGTKARRQLMKVYQVPCHVFLEVKVLRKSK